MSTHLTARSSPSQPSEGPRRGSRPHTHASSPHALWLLAELLPPYVAKLSTFPLRLVYTAYLHPSIVKTSSYIFFYKL